jgi:hypothetical protein
MCITYTNKKPSRKKVWVPRPLFDAWRCQHHACLSRGVMPVERQHACCSQHLSGPRQNKYSTLHINVSIKLFY